MLQPASLPESNRFVIPREVARRSVFIRSLRTLVGVLVFALVSGYPVADVALVQTVQAEEEEQPAEESESEAPNDEKQESQNPQPQDEDDRVTSSEETTDEPAEDEPAPKESAKDEAADEEPDDEEPAKDEVAEKEPGKTEPEEVPAKKSKSDEKSTKEDVSEQEQGAETVDDEMTDAEKAADEEEEAKAAEAEAAGAEVEVDESDEIEEEPEDSEKSPNRPKVNGDKPVKETPSSEKRVIGATATIMEKQSELLFRARVDSGAKSCSLHIEDYKIENESDTMAENIGKVITFHIKNGNGESHWLSAKIAGYVVVKTAAHRGRRYKVPLTLRFKDFEKTVLVTLNNREKMEFPLLLGRNFLMGDFVIDVEVDNSELHTR